MKYPKVVYRDVRGWKYVVEKEIVYATSIKGYLRTISYKEQMLACLEPDGTLRVFPDYAWDGPSGPTVDTPDWMDASLVHDIFYQLMRTRQIPDKKDRRSREKIRKKADKLMKKMLIEAGMSRFRAWYSYQGVRLFAAWAANPRFDKVRV